ncbi:hypothetical protein MG293_002013, partial [Ovis ammon polii]
MTVPLLEYGLDLDLLKEKKAEVTVELWRKPESIEDICIPNPGFPPFLNTSPEPSAPGLQSRACLCNCPARRNKVLRVAGQSPIIVAFQHDLLSMEGEAFEMALKDGRALTFGDGVKPHQHSVAKRHELKCGSEQ